MDKLRELVRLIKVTVPWYVWAGMLLTYFGLWIGFTPYMAEAHRVAIIVTVLLPIILFSAIITFGGIAVSIVSLLSTLGFYNPPEYFTFINVLTLPLRLSTIGEPLVELLIETIDGWGK